MRFLSKIVLSAETRKNYSKTHLKFCESGSIDIRKRIAFSRQSRSQKNRFSRPLFLSVSKKVLCMHILLSSLSSLLILNFVIFYRVYAEIVLFVIFFVCWKAVKWKNNSNSILKTLCAHASNCLYKFVWFSFKQSNGLFCILNLIYGYSSFILLLTLVQFHFSCFSIWWGLSLFELSSKVVTKFNSVSSILHVKTIVCISLDVYWPGLRVCLVWKQLIHSKCKSALCRRMSSKFWGNSPIRYLNRQLWWESEFILSKGWKVLRNSRLDLLNNIAIAPAPSQIEFEPTFVRQ